MAKAQAWQCDVCGYVHEGDSPPDVCPVCGVGPEHFQPVSENDDSGAEEPNPTSWRCTVCDYVHEGPEPPPICPVCGVDHSFFEPLESDDKGSSPASAPTPRDGEHLVIVGAGAAGVAAAESARKTDPHLRITLCSDEPWPTYVRLNLTRYLAGELTEQDLISRENAWFEKRDIQLVRGTIHRIEPHAQRLVREHGESLTYDRLILTTGAHPFMPPIQGADTAGVMVCRTREDANRILDSLKDGLPCVCVGGGLLGLENAGALARRGARVTVVEHGDRLMPRQLAEPASSRLQKHLNSMQVDVICSARVDRIETRSDSTLAVHLHDGTIKEAGLVLVTAGIRPNLELARQADLEVNHGVVVDDHLRTSDPRIFAAGDVAEHCETLYGLWTMAQAQGRIAGINAAGGNQTFSQQSPPTWLKVLDVKVFSMGVVEPRPDQDRVLEQESEDAYARIILHCDRIIGANLFGDLSLADEIQSAIQKQTPVNELEQVCNAFGQLWP